MAGRPALETEPRSRYHGMRMPEAAYLALPEEKPYLEHIGGVVVQKPMVNSEHGDLVGEIDGRLWAYRRSHGGKFGPERRVRLPSGDHLLPDTAYWAPGRPSGDDSIPTLAVEVRSPGDSMEAQRAKCRLFRASGVEVCWLVDPDSRTVEVFEGEEARTLRAGDVLQSSHLPGFELPVVELFGVLDD